MRDYATVREAAEEFGVSEITIWRLLRRRPELRIRHLYKLASVRTLIDMTALERALRDTGLKRYEDGRLSHWGDREP